MEFLHRVDRIAEVFEGVVRLERADPSAVQIDRLATGNCRQILGATSLLRFHRPTHGMCESGFFAGHFERVVVNEPQKSMCYHPLRQAENATWAAAMS